MHILTKRRTGRNRPAGAETDAAERSVKAERQLDFRAALVTFKYRFKGFYPFGVQAGNIQSLAEQASAKACTETPRSLMSFTGGSSSPSSVSLSGE